MFLQQQLVRACRRRLVAQLVFLDLPFGQQRLRPQRTRRILRPQKLILSHCRFRTLRILERPSLIRQQLRHRVHRRRRVHIRRIRVVNRPIQVHRPRVVRLRPVAFWRRLQRIAPALRLLPRRQCHNLLRGVAPGSRCSIRRRPGRAAARCRQAHHPRHAPCTSYPPHSSSWTREGHRRFSLRCASLHHPWENRTRTPPDTPKLRQSIRAGNPALRKCKAMPHPPSAAAPAYRSVERR